MLDLILITGYYKLDISRQKDFCLCLLKVIKLLLISFITNIPFAFMCLVDFVAWFEVQGQCKILHNKGIGELSGIKR